MDPYDTFVFALKKQALAAALRKKSVYGAEQAENEAVHMVGDGLALVDVEAATQDPELVAFHYARCWDSLPITDYPPDAQWALCPLTKRQVFLHVVDVGAAARDELRHQGHGEQIRQDAASLVEEGDLEDVSPFRAAIAFLFAWPDFTGGSDEPWLAAAYRRSQRRQNAGPPN